jgi:MFS family permease
VFSDPSWLIKTLMGTLLLVVPPLAFGYVYRMSEQGRRGQPAELPDWDDWRGLFFDGLKMLLLLLIFTLAPILLGWLVALFLTWLLEGVPLFWAFAGFLYLPLVPVLVLALPVTAASLYRYQRRWDFRDALQLPALLRMVVATKGRLVVPTLAYIGLLTVLFPILPYALFTGAVVLFYFYGLVFQQTVAVARPPTSDLNRESR